MAGLPNVSIQYQNGGLGLVASADDRVVGMVFNGYSESASPFAVFSYADFLSKESLLLAPGQPLNGFIKSEVLDFYQEAGSGRELWIKTVAPERLTAAIFTGGMIAEMMLLSEGRVNVIGISRKLLADPDPITRTGGLDADLMAAMDEAQALGEDLAAQHQPVRFIFDGRYAATDLTTLASQKAKTFNRVGVCIAAKAIGSKNACLGLLLGRIAASPVNRNIGRVRSGSVGVDTGYFTNGVAVTSLATGALDALHDKGFIFLRKFVNKSGYYWNDDHMAVADTDDYYSLSNGRTIDKVARLAYATFVEELNETVFVDDKGKIIKTTLKQYQENIERAIGLSMAAAGEISNVEAFVDPNQDIISTSTLVVDLRITPTGTSRIIRIKLGLNNPNAA